MKTIRQEDINGVLVTVKNPGMSPILKGLIYIWAIASILATILIIKMWLHAQEQDRLMKDLDGLSFRVSWIEERVNSMHDESLGFINHPGVTCKGDVVYDSLRHQ